MFGNPPDPTLGVLLKRGTENGTEHGTERNTERNGKRNESFEGKQICTFG